MNIPTVLSVEDSSDDQVLTVMALESLDPKPAVVTIGSLSQARDFLFRRGSYASRKHVDDPDLVLLDLNLDGQLSLDLINEIRRNAEMQDLPIVVFSAQHTPDALLQCYENGANSCVSKPGDPQEYRDTVQAIGNYWLNISALPADR